MFVGGNLVAWKSKKQSVVSRSSSEAEYRAMAAATSEVVWLKALVGELGFPTSSPIKLFCDNQSAIYIASNPVFHERTKHIEVDCHFIRQKVQDQTIVTPHIRSQDQLADIFTKNTPVRLMEDILIKLGSIDIYSPNLRGSVEDKNNAEYEEDKSTVEEKFAVESRPGPCYQWLDGSLKAPIFSLPSPSLHVYICLLGCS